MKTRVVLIATLVVAACGDNDVPGEGDDDDVVEAARDFTVRIDNVAPWTVLKSGTQAIKTNDREGQAGPGETFEIKFTARDHQFISFATMLGESNDWFFAPGPEGIPLFTDGQPTTGDVTRYVKLWNAGTEIDQEPAVGNATGPRQPSPNFGPADPAPGVRELPLEVRLSDGGTFKLPKAPRMIRVTLKPGPDQLFTLRIYNVSGPNTLNTSQGPIPIHLSPVAWAMHIAPAPLFVIGQPTRGTGLEALAEDGAAAALGASLAATSGFATPLSPGVFVVANVALAAPLFVEGSPDLGEGLEALAEDGNATPLRDALQLAPGTNGAFEVAVGAPAAGPAIPGQAFQFTVRGAPGDAMSLATMFGMSNDWFFATLPAGISLFDGVTPRSGDVTSEVLLFDAGTEIDEEVAIGPATAPQQLAPNTGALDPVGVVRQVTPDRYGLPAAAHLRVTVTPL